MNQKVSDTVKYVLTANTSQSRGLRNCGHMSIWFGMGSIQYGSQGRPMCRAGNISAQMTAKMVIASAARLIAVRQFCRSRNKMAEMSVPA